VASHARTIVARLNVESDNGLLAAVAWWLADLSKKGSAEPTSGPTPAASPRLREDVLGEATSR